MTRLRERALGNGWKLIAGESGLQPTLMSPEGRVYTANDSIKSKYVAVVLDVSPSEIRMLRQAGRLESFPSGYTFEVLVDSLLNYLEHGRPLIMVREGEGMYRSKTTEGYRLVKDTEGRVWIGTPFGPVTGHLGESFSSEEEARGAIVRAIAEGLPDLPIVKDKE